MTLPRVIGADGPVGANESHHDARGAVVGSGVVPAGAGGGDERRGAPAQWCGRYAPASGGAMVRVDQFLTDTEATFTRPKMSTSTSSTFSDQTVCSRPKNIGMIGMS